VAGGRRIVLRLIRSSLRNVLRAADIQDKALFLQEARMIAHTETLTPEDARSAPRFLDALQTKIEPVSLSLPYRAALGIVACAMVLLPLMYLTLVGLVSWGVVWYVMKGWPFLASLSLGVFHVLLLGTPPIVGVTVVLFLIKPLFFREKRHSDEVRLDPAEEDVLFDFVRRTASAVGAPEPQEIRLDNRVNASASFRRGMLSLFSDDLVLTLGMPLAAGLTLQQLAGVLAHEFGHFGQRAGMRLSYVIRSVNHWFARVVYARDRFDDDLEHSLEQSDSLQVQVTASIASFCVRMSREILKKLMYLGNVISSSLLRQMEYDADRYAVRLVGRNVHASILRDIFLLSHVYQISLSAVLNRYRQGTLTDSLATLMQANRRQLACRLDEAYREHLAGGRTHLFDTHPTDSERIAKGLSGPVEGVFASDLPASVLFRDFARLERARSRSLFEKLPRSAAVRGLRSEQVPGECSAPLDLAAARGDAYPLAHVQRTTFDRDGPVHDEL
jgi:Zn-dependent protease with chaperone function